MINLFLSNLFLSIVQSPQVAPRQSPLQTITPALIALVGVLLTAALGFWQWRKSQASQRELEHTKLQWEKEKLAWEREKLLFEQQAALDKLAKEADIERQARRQEAEDAATEERLAEAEKVQTARQHASRYCSALMSELKNLKILDMSKPLSLDEVYVTVQVREDQPTTYTKEEEMARLAQGDPAELLRGDDLKTRPTNVTFAPEDALFRFSRVAVLGDPGAGKTTMLRYLAFRIARGDFIGTIDLPIYIELRRFIDSKLEDLTEFIAWDWSTRYGFVEAADYLEQELSEGRAALLLDGLDEVLGGGSPEEAQAAYKRVSDEVNRIATRYHNVPIAITCRRAGWRPTLATFQTLQVLDFDWSQISRFVRNWYANDSAKATGLSQALAGNLRMQTLAANPLILSLIAIVYERELELPERRAELYNRCVDVLLREWDAHRGIKRFARFTTDRKRDLLQELAWHFHRAGLRYFPEVELLEFISQFLPSINIRPDEAEAILEEIAAQYGLLKVQAHGWYGFLHLTLQEYFTALATNEKGQAGLREVIEHRHDPWWEEVILLLAGRMNDATPLLEGILGRLADHPIEDMSPLALRDDFFHGDLLLAGRCLVGTPRINQPALRERLIKEISAIITTSPYQLDRERAAQVLVGIGSDESLEYVLTLLVDSDVDLERRRDVAESLKGTTDGVTARRLEGLLVERSSTLDPSIQTRIFQALGRWESRSMVGWLLDRLEQSDDLYLKAGIAEALGLIGHKGAVPQLMNELMAINEKTRSDSKSNFDERYELDDYGRAVIGALESIGEKSIVDELVPLLGNFQPISFSRAATALVTTTVRLGDSATRMKLFDLMADEEFEGDTRFSIATDLQQVVDSDIARECLERLTDEGLNWSTKWLIAEVLGANREFGLRPLQGMLGQPKLAQEVRVAVATALGRLGYGDGIPYMREAITRWTIDPSLKLGTTTWTGYCWNRTCEALKELGDDSVVPALIQYFEECVKGRRAIDASTIAYAAEPYKPERIARLQLEMMLTDKSASDEWSLARLIGKPVVAHVLSTIKKLSEAPSQSPRIRWQLVVQAIGKVADDPQAVRDLFSLTLSTKGDVYHSALFATCRRARVRIFPDGKMEQIGLSARPS